MRGKYTAVIKKDGDWWIGWIEEIPGVNCQEKTHDQLIKSLKEALKVAIEFNRKEALKAAKRDYREEPVTI